MELGENFWPDLHDGKHYAAHASDALALGPTDVDVLIKVIDHVDDDDDDDDDDASKTHVNCFICLCVFI